MPNIKLGDIVYLPKDEWIEGLDDYLKLGYYKVGRHWLCKAYTGDFLHVSEHNKNAIYVALENLDGTRTCTAIEINKLILVKDLKKEVIKLLYER